MSAYPLEDICPNCGNWVTQLDDSTGFCEDCTPSNQEPPQTSRIELWLRKNANIIESSMLEQQITAKEAITQIVQEMKVHCLVCKEEIERATNGRHFLCTKHEKCRKARRYYKYLHHEKGMSKEDALEKAVKKFTQ